jgi:hypothetical protein
MSQRSPAAVLEIGMKRLDEGMPLSLQPRRAEISLCGLARDDRDVAYFHPLRRGDDPGGIQRTSAPRPGRRHVISVNRLARVQSFDKGLELGFLLRAPYCWNDG